MDALAYWPDGSVKFASLAMKVPAMCASSELPLLIVKGRPDTAAAKPIDLKNGGQQLQVTLTFTGGSYTGIRKVDLGSALRASLSERPDYWLRGPLVTQARVDVPLNDEKSISSSTLHVSADVSLFADGTAAADVQFHNDIATVLPQTGKSNPEPPLPPLAYTAEITFSGKRFTQTVNQFQYTSWHKVVWNALTPTYNIQHDVAQLLQTGAVLPYDLDSGVSSSLLQNYQKNIVNAPDFGTPLSRNGVSTYMPGTGARPDIGFTTQINTAWLVTQDSRAATVAMAQSDTSGAIPWNYKLSNGKWLSPASHPRIWIDGRGGPRGSTDGIANLADTSVWSPDTSHQPNLNFIPYIMTGQRWNLDRQLAQTSFNLIASWPGYRCKPNSCSILLNGADQLRGQAWSLREVIQTHYVASEKTNISLDVSSALRDNWSYIKKQMQLWKQQQGEASGWIPGDYGRKGATAEWQQDFFTVVVAWAALMGDADAKEVVSAQIPWLAGRFQGKDMNPHDGCTYNLMVYDPGSGIFFKTWKEIEAATTKAGLSNINGWKQSDGYYCQLAMASLSSVLHIYPDNVQLASALDWLENANAPYTSRSGMKNDPTYNIRRP